MATEKRKITIQAQVRAFGTCGCKRWCADEQGEPDLKQRPYGGCEVKAEAAGCWSPPAEEEPTP